MNELVKRLAGEKIMDDFSGHGRVGRAIGGTHPDRQTKIAALIESEVSEGCGQELRRFADFFARMVLQCSGAGTIGIGEGSDS